MLALIFSFYNNHILYLVMSSRARANVANYATVKAALVKQAAAVPATPVTSVAPWTPPPTIQQRLTSVEKAVGNTEQLQGALVAVVNALEKIEKLQDRLVNLEKLAGNVDQLNQRIAALEAR